MGNEDDKLIIMQQKTFTVQVLKTDEEYLFLAYDNLRTKIKKNLIDENQLEIIDNKIELSHVFFEHWFSSSILAEINNRVDNFLTHIPLFWAHRNIILKEPKYYSIEVPFSFVYFKKQNPYDNYSETQGITLGELFEIWLCEEIFWKQCDVCGGRSAVYSWGHTLVGNLYGHFVCLQCGILETGRLTDISKVSKIQKNYKPIEPIAENPVSVEELVKVCNEYLT
jgi:hypothetical protein